MNDKLTTFKNNEPSHAIEPEKTIQIAATPPMGWNSWDCYGASVTEEEVKANAEHMARYLKPYGWEYIVVDARWYDSGAQSSILAPFVPLECDEYSRFIPATNRFPSSAGGKGFKPLADYIHGLGLKFGIHIMRGIPRQAVHANTSILATEVRAKEIAHPNSICSWNADIYGINSTIVGAQDYYNSLFSLYASWGLDFVKVDDITFPYSEGEIELIRNAIENCGRTILLSLSPGPAPLDKSDHLKKHANMWRITADYWDRWEDLLEEFEKCNQWSCHSGSGHWPDADMLPLGHIALRSCEHGLGDRVTRFSREEQVTMMTLWCIFRSPLMLGCELRDTDPWTLSLLTNPEVLRVLKHSSSGRQLFRRDQIIAWMATDEDGSQYLAVFNIGVVESKAELQLRQMGLAGTYIIRDLWKRENLYEVDRAVSINVPPHGARLLKFRTKEV